MEAWRLSAGRASHWEAAYTSKQAEEQSWFQSHPYPSLQAIERIGAQASDSVVDIGAGSSPLLALLADSGWSDLTALDISAAALARGRANAGALAEKIEWVNEDVTLWQPARSFDIWHDRAVFHFLTEAADRKLYKSALMAGLRPEGYLIIATFALDGPQKCSGLTVQRYDEGSLVSELGEGFELIADWRELHRTPFDTQQSFQWCIFRRTAD